MHNFSIIFKSFINGLKDLFGTSAISNNLSSCDQNQTALEDKKTSAYSKWWNRKNAEYIRDNCFIYTSLLFPENKDFEKAFGTTLSKYFSTHGNWRIAWDFPEIHTTFLAVDVFYLLDRWNKWDIDLKKMLLTDLRQAYVNYAQEKGYPLYSFFNGVIADVWYIDDYLVLAIPNSEFPVTYKKLVLLLASDIFRSVLSECIKKTKF